MRLEHLVYLLTVRQYQSITKAAKALYITQPALGAAISAFEKEVGFSIFQRTRQGTIPTAKGQKLLDEAEAVLKTINGWKAMADTPHDIEGEVSILATPALCNSILINVILSLKNKYPNLVLRLNSYRMIGLLQEYQKSRENFILNIHTSEDLSFLDHYNLQGEIIGHDNYNIFICSDNPLSQKESLTVRDLAHLPIVTYMEREKGFSYPEFFSYFDQRNTAGFSTREQIMQVVSQNKAAAIFPKISAINDYYVTTGLTKPLPVEDYPLPLVFYLAYPKNHRFTACEKIVYDELQAHFEKIAPFLTH